MALCSWRGLLGWDGTPPGPCLLSVGACGHGRPVRAALCDRQDRPANLHKTPQATGSPSSDSTKVKPSCRAVGTPPSCSVSHLCLPDGSKVSPCHPCQHTWPGVLRSGSRAAPVGPADPTGRGERGAAWRHAPFSARQAHPAPCSPRQGGHSGVPTLLSSLGQCHIRPRMWREEITHPGLRSMVCGNNYFPPERHEMPVLAVRTARGDSCPSALCPAALE